MPLGANKVRIFLRMSHNNNCQDISHFFRFFIFEVRLYAYRRKLLLFKDSFVIPTTPLQI